MSTSTTPLFSGSYYHIYNRGNNKECLFREERNYAYFLSLYVKHVVPCLDTLSYCLMPNHFHLLVRIPEFGDPAVKTPSQALSNCFNAYAKAFNKCYQRTGSLFQDRFRRIMITNEEYLRVVVLYIHLNPVKHGMTRDFRSWPWSSYRTLTASRGTWLRRKEVIDWFVSAADFRDLHDRSKDLYAENPLNEWVDRRSSKRDLTPSTLLTIPADTPSSRNS